MNQVDYQQKSVKHRGRRLALHLVGLVAIKIVVLIAIYEICFRPFGRPVVTPTAVATHILAAPPSSQGSAHD
jgi:hypothetical protein